MSIFKSSEIHRRSFIGTLLSVSAPVFLAQKSFAQNEAQSRQERSSSPPQVIVFDVIETLLDIRVLEPHFQRAFGRTEVLLEWFSQVLLYSMAGSLSGPYLDFATPGGAALDMVATYRGVKVSQGDREQILKGMLSLPPYAEVSTQLQRLKDAGFRLVTLTNSSLVTVQKQLQHAGLFEYFEANYSVEPVRRYKPAPETYSLVEEKLGLPADSLLLVAAHAWDIIVQSKQDGVRHL